MKEGKDMPKNEIVVVDNLKHDLQKEAKVMFKKIAISFLNDAKKPLSDYVSYCAKCIIDHIIIQLNA